MMIKLSGISCNFLKNVNFLQELAVSQLESFLEAIFDRN